MEMQCSGALSGGFCGNVPNRLPFSTLFPAFLMAVFLPELVSVWYSRGKKANAAA